MASPPGGQLRSSAAVTLALGAGVIGAVQPRINAELGHRLDSSLLASLVNFGVAFAAVLVALALRPGTRRRLGDLPSWPVPRWMLSAGLGGALVVLAGAVAVGTIGVAVFSVAFFAGQIASSLLVDRLGVGPGGVRPLVPARVQAAVVAVAAVVVSQIGRPLGEFAPALVLLVVASGAGVTFQSAFNGRITEAVGDPVAATALNVTVGLVALAVAAVVVGASTGFDGGHWPSAVWLYSGGVLGVTIVLSLAISTAAIGVLRTSIAMLAAQLIAAFVVDWIVENEAPTPGVLAGAVLVVVAVVLLRRD